MHEDLSFIDVPTDVSARLETVLARVARPGRYVGSEYNAVHKDPARVRVRMALVFPDLYEIGMSHLGMKILYGLVNRHPDCWAERAFMPWPDMEDAMKQSGIPLYTLESRTPLAHMSVIGFSVQTELCFSNVLACLLLADLPLRTEDRLGGAFPWVVAGGPAIVNPEVLSPFVDLFVIGDGEEVLEELLSFWREIAGKRWPGPREDLLVEAARRIPGVYVPCAYEQGGDPDSAASPRHAGVAPQVKKRVVKDLDSAFFSTHPPVPSVGVVHDRAQIEILRGCPHRCRFCQAASVYGPLRERSVDVLVSQSCELIARTGYEELCLSSLSSGDFSHMEELITALNAAFRSRPVRLSLPSLRAESRSVKIADLLGSRRKNSVTLAPEAGTERLRKVINKGISDDMVIDAAREAFHLGWKRLKLYFMVGLPTESLEDVAAIADMVRSIRAVRRKLSGKRADISVTVSAFVPKPHTAFQWAPMEEHASLREKQEYLRSCGLSRAVKWQMTDVRAALWESILARGNRKIGSVLERGVRAGARFDQWEEWFRWERWEAALHAEGLEPSHLVRERRGGPQRSLPWDVVDCGPGKAFLWSEWERALSGAPSARCARSACGPGDFTREQLDAS